MPAPDTSLGGQTAPEDVRSVVGVKDPTNTEEARAMLTVEETTVIDRPREEVYDVAVTTETRPTWSSNVLEIDAERPGHPEQGDRHAVTSKVAGKRFASTEEVTEVLPGERLAYRSEEGPFPYRVEFRFADEGDATRMTIFVESPGLGGLFGRLSDPLVVTMFSRDLRANLANLKTLVEHT
jgi:uncharacterized protein YndB with AHSA1/START domain